MMTALEADHQAPHTGEELKFVHAYFGRLQADFLPAVIVSRVKSVFHNLFLFNISQMISFVYV